MFKPVANLNLSIKMLQTHTFSMMKLSYSSLYLTSIKSVVG